MRARLKMRVIHKRCDRCGMLVSFKVWRGFKPIAKWIAGVCEGCKKVHTLKEDRT